MPSTSKMKWSLSSRLRVLIQDAIVTVIGWKSPGTSDGLFWDPRILAGKFGQTVSRSGKCTPAYTKHLYMYTCHCTQARVNTNTGTFTCAERLNYMALHCITLHYITLPYVTLPHVTLRYIRLHYITLPYLTLHCTTLHYITLHYIT